MGAITIQEGQRVKIRKDGRVGTVLALTPVRTGQRGRPTTLASVICEDMSEVLAPVRTLRAV